MRVVGCQNSEVFSGFFTEFLCWLSKLGQSPRLLLLLLLLRFSLIPSLKVGWLFHDAYVGLLTPDFSICRYFSASRTRLHIHNAFYA